MSTISRGGGAVGANPQSEETDELDADNAEWVSETLNRNLTERVIRYHFGEDTPVLVELKLRTKTRDNVRQDLMTVDKAKSYGVRVSRPWFTKKFGVVEAEEGEAALGEAQGKTQDFKTQDAREEAAATALNDAGGAMDRLMRDLRAALAKDMQGIGDALWNAWQAGDFAAVQAALRKISKDMPELAESEEFATVLSGGLAEALLGSGETAEASNQARHNPQDRGGRGRFVTWTRPREIRDKSARDAYGRKLHTEMTADENYERVTKSVEWALRNKTSIQGAAYRKGLGNIDLPWGNTGDKSADHKGGFGLAHILSKHPGDIKGLAEVIAYGELKPGQDQTKREVWLGRRVAAFVKDNESSSWLLTSYSDD